MLPLSTYTDRLAAQVPALKRVAGFASWVAAKGQVTDLPAAYVMPDREQADPSAMIGAHDQRISESFTVVLVGKNVADQRGMAAQNDLQALSASVRAALMGWQPSAAHTPVDLVSAGPLELTNQLLIWPETYQTTTYART